jgi:hypothetical protein
MFRLALPTIAVLVVQTFVGVTVVNVVIDHETVTRSFPDGPGEVDVIAIYEVRTERLQRPGSRWGPPGFIQP